MTTCRDLRLKRKGHLLTHKLKRSFRQQRIDYVLVRTDQSLEVVLSSYLASRR